MQVLTTTKTVHDTDPEWALLQLPNVRDATAQQYLSEEEIRESGLSR
jgi:hypothetical protein